MATDWARRAARQVLPEGTPTWLPVRSPSGPGGQGPFNRTLDRWAAHRTMKAVLRETDCLRHVRWLDHGVWQFPIDAWILQEMISSLRPELIVETGTHRGGSAYFFATLFDLLGIDGEVLSVDVAAEATIPHPRITFLAGSSTDPDIVERIAVRAQASRQVLVILDSDHTAEHVSGELQLYAPLVPVGGYLHVQDGWVDELGFTGRGNRGPAAAVQQFLAGHAGFVRDVHVERRYVLTANPYGWLRRIAEDAPGTTAIRPV